MVYLKTPIESSTHKSWSSKLLKKTAQPIEEKAKVFLVKFGELTAATIMIQRARPTGSASLSRLLKKSTIYDESFAMPGAWPIVIMMSTTPSAQCAAVIANRFPGADRKYPN